MPACAMVYQWRITPGREQAFMELYGELSKQFESLGAKRQRLWNQQFGTGNTGQPITAWVVEFDSAAEYGAFTDSMGTPEILALMAKAYGPDAPGEIVGNGLAHDMTP